MGKTKRLQQAIYLDQKKAELLDKLSAETGAPKQHYFREAVDLLLVQYGLLKPRRKLLSGARGCVTSTRAPTTSHR
jgi:hypothetical protein